MSFSSSDDGDGIEQHQHSNNNTNSNLLPYVSSWLPPSLLHSPSSPSSISSPQFKSVSSVNVVKLSTTTNNNNNNSNTASSSSSTTNGGGGGGNSIINQQQASSSSPVDEKTLSDMDDEWNHIIEQYQSLIKQNNEHEANHDLFNILEGGGNGNNNNLSLADKRKSMLVYPSSRSMMLTSTTTSTNNNNNNITPNNNNNNKNDNEKNKKKTKFSSLRKKQRNKKQQQQHNNNEHKTVAKGEQPLQAADPDFPTLSFCDLMLMGATASGQNQPGVTNSTTTTTTPHLIRYNTVGSNIHNHHHHHHHHQDVHSSLSSINTMTTTPSSTINSSTNTNTTSSSIVATPSSTKGNGDNDMSQTATPFTHPQLLPTASTTPLSPSFPKSTASLTTKPLSLDLSKLKVKSSTSNQQSTSCQTPEVVGSEKRKIFKRRERSASSFSLGGNQKHPDSPSQRHNRLNNSDSNSNARLQQGMSYTKWSELIQNNGAFARINNVSPSSPALGQNDEDSQSVGNDILSHDSTEIFDQLEDILSYQLPISPRYRTYSKSSKKDHSDEQDDLSAHTSQDIIDNDDNDGDDDDDVDDLIDGAINNFNRANEHRDDSNINNSKSPSSTSSNNNNNSNNTNAATTTTTNTANSNNNTNNNTGNNTDIKDSNVDLQFALIGSRGKMADWMKEKENLQNLPSLRESRSPTGAAGAAGTENSRKRDSSRLISKSRFSLNSRSAINLNSINNIEKTSLIEDIDSEKSTSFTEGNSPQFRPKGRKRSLSHIMVNASVCLHFSIDNFKGIDEFIREEQEKINFRNENSTSSSNHNGDQSFCVQLHVLHRVKRLNNTYAWISLIHTQSVNLLSLESFNSSDKSKITSDVVHFETSATLPFNFEKVTPLLFALISTRTNQVLGSYEGCLAEICGSQQLIIRRKLIKQKKHFCDLVVKASIPTATGNEKRLSVNGVKEQLLNSPSHRFNSTTTANNNNSIDLFNDIPNTDSPLMSDTSSSTTITTPDLLNNNNHHDNILQRKKLRVDSSRKRKKSSKIEEIYLDFDEIQTKLEKKYKDCFLVVSQQFYTDQNQLGSFIPLYTSETNTKFTKTPSFEPFSIKPTLEFFNITFRFELFYWVSIDKQQYDDLDVVSPRREISKQSPIDAKKSSSARNTTTTIGHYRRLIGSTEVNYTDFIKFFDLPSMPNSTIGGGMSGGLSGGMGGIGIGGNATPPTSAVAIKKEDNLLLGPFFHISSTGLNEASANSTTTPRRTRKSLKNVTFEGDGVSLNSGVVGGVGVGGGNNNNGSSNNNTPTNQQQQNNSTINRASPLTMKLFVDRRVHMIKEETLAPQGMDPIEDENNPSVVHRRRKVLTVVNTQSGSLTFKSVKERKVLIEEQTDLDVTYTFLDYMKTGLRFKCYFALDFTKDNTEPRNEGNLHIAPKGQKSIYEQCIDSISKRIFQYDPNMTDFHLVGFGNDTMEPVFNLYGKGDELLDEETMMYFRDLDGGSSEDKSSQNYIYSVLYPRYYPPLKIHQLSPIYRQYMSSTGGGNFKLSMQDCIKNRHYAFTETNVHKGTRDLTNANLKFNYDQDHHGMMMKHNSEKQLSSPEFIHLNYMESPKVNSTSSTSNLSIKSPTMGGGGSSNENDNKKGSNVNNIGNSFKSSLFKSNIFDSNKMTSKYAPNDYYPVISDVIDLSCNLKNEESIAQTLLYLYREQQMSKMGHRNSCSSTTSSTDSSGAAAAALMNITPVLYNILVILIPNDFIHVEETIYKFVEASHKAALSIIVVGVGSGCGFKTHRSINTNTDVVSNTSSSGGGGKTLQYRIQTIVPTTTDLQYRGLRAARGCVTFVRLNDHETVNEAVEAALQHIPKQVCRYMKMKGKEILKDNK